MARVFKFVGGLVLLVATIGVMWTIILVSGAIKSASAAPDAGSHISLVLSSMFLAASVWTTFSYWVAAWAVGAWVYVAGHVLEFVERHTLELKAADREARRAIRHGGPEASPPA